MALFISIDVVRSFERTFVLVILQPCCVAANGEYQSRVFLLVHDFCWRSLDKQILFSVVALPSPVFQKSNNVSVGENTRYQKVSQGSPESIKQCRVASRIVNHKSDFPHLVAPK
jgi:hypothetical protein